MTDLATKLSVDDEDFLISSMIERCPKSMMLRELVMNAVEAAKNTVGSNGKVWIGTTTIDGTPKLTIRNSGPGMDAERLHRMCNIAASIGKEKGLKGNFGMGAKVASLPSNHLGMRYRSCAQGRVHEIVLGKYNGVYGRLVQAQPDGPASDILNVTVQYDAARLAEDWTEVVLFGQYAGQDTVIDPYDGDPVVPSYWIPEALYHRFYEIPDNVEILLEEGIHWLEGDERFRSISSRKAPYFAQAEAVTTANGIVIHYLYDPAHAERAWENASSEHALQTATSTLGLVHRGELYDVKFGSPWAYMAPLFGISFSARHISVHVELPEDFPVVADAYRQFLRYEDGEQSQVEVREFADLVREHRPQWLLALLDQLGMQRQLSSPLKSELSDLRKLLGVKLYTHVERPPGWTPEDEGWVEPDLEVVQLTDPQDIRDRWLLGRAACYYPDTRQLFVNTTYESIELLAAQLVAGGEGRHEAAHGAGVVETEARLVAVEAIVRRIARVLLHGLSKASRPDLWQAGHIEKATAPEALSVAADDWVDALAGCEAVLQERLSAMVA